MKLILSVFVIVFIFTFQTSAQVLFPGYITRDYYDVLLLKNDDIIEPIALFPSIINRYAPSDSVMQWDIWDDKFKFADLGNKNFIKVLDPYSSFSYSSEFPIDYNDGAVWTGKGFNASLNFGVTGKVGILHFTLAPVVYYAQNVDFYIPTHQYPKSEYSYPFENRIDWALKFGSDRATKIHPGQSEIRLVFKNATFGLSTQNMKWGPAPVNPIIMSTNAGGIPHLDLGTAVPAKTRIGKIEFRIFWGQMNESAYFDSNNDNDKRYFTGAIFGYQPSFIPGLSLGINRVLYKRWFDGNLKVTDLFAAVLPTISDPEYANDAYDQIGSLFIRWKFKEFGFESYMEVARNDNPGNLNDLFENPDRTRAVTMGLIKTFDFENGSLFRFVYEYTKLNKNKLSVIYPGGSPTYYVHSVVENGYANNGQIMGAYIGPGSNAHHVKFQYYYSKGLIGINFDRVRYNDDYFISQFTGATEYPTDMGYRLGLQVVRFVGDFSFDSEVAWGFRRNWYYEIDRDTHNFSASLKVRYILNRKI